MTKNKVRLIFSIVSLLFIAVFFVCVYGLYSLPNPGKGTPLESTLLVACFTGLFFSLFGLAISWANVMVPQVFAREWDGE